MRNGLAMDHIFWPAVSEVADDGKGESGVHSARFKEEIFTQGVDERAFMFKIPYTGRIDRIS